MSLFKKYTEQGISLRFTHIIMILISVIIACILVLETFLTSNKYHQLSDATDDYIEMEHYAQSLMDASDYLTEEVQCFTVTSDIRHLERYFDEADVQQRREKAVDKLTELSSDTAASRRLELALSSSVELMNTEYYAMVLMIDALDITEYPEILDTVEIDAADRALSKEEKILKAQQMVHDENYYAYKRKIHDETKQCLEELIASTQNVQSGSDNRMQIKLRVIRLLVIIQTIATITVLWLTSYLGIIPILKGVEKIKEDSEIPVIGSYEFRYLAKTYNKMYEAFKKSIANLNYDASHDKLTGLYNRAGYDVLSKSIDLPTTAALLIDADRFKEINDNYGHATGDKILQKLAAALKRTFRSEDYICRIGGDEFVVYMLHVTPELVPLIEAKIARINAVLQDTADDLPPLSVSVGAAFGADAESAKELVKNADEALYAVKEAGRCGCRFYQKSAQPGS